jgi:uncharacterized Zn-finger protein
MNKRLKLACRECKREFGNKYNLKVHVQDVHGQAHGPVSCPYCKKLFKNKSSLRYHHYRHHNIKGKSVTDIQTHFAPHDSTF